MRPGRIVALVIGCLLVIPAIAMLLAGSALGLGYAFGRGDDGYFDVTIDRLSSETSAITTDDVNLGADPGSPAWLLDTLDADVRLRATNADTSQDVFIGIAREADVEAYLAGVAHDEIIEIDDDLAAIYRSRTGTATVAPPTEQTIWVASESGPGTQQLDWEASTGRWSAVLMNADGSPGVAADVNVGAKAAFVLPLALIMLGAGIVGTAIAISLIVAGAHGAGAGPASSPHPLDDPAVPINVGERLGRLPHPVTLEARLDPGLSRWLWLVKWILAIPHFVVLAFLWVAFIVLTLVAAVSILFTGRYPDRIFDFNVGVLRWSWRVSHYATSGGIGTDEYPRFSLHAEPGDPATLNIARPGQLSRGLVLVKWFLAIPHLVIVGLLSGPTIRWTSFGGDGFDLTAGGGLLGLLVIVTGVMLLVTGRYPASLFDLIVGLNRWIYRVIAYVALMTDEYPPFRLDQGGTDPMRPLGPPPTPTPGEVDLRQSFPSYDDERRTMQ